MTVPSETYKKTYNGDGSTTVFGYTFRILDDDEILVQIKSAAGVITTKTKTTDYTVSGVGGSSGGSVTMVTAPASGETLILTRNMSFTQSTDYVENDALPADTLEDDLDRSVMRDQQLKESLDRTVKLDPTVTGFDATLPNPSGNANSFIKINSTEDGLEADSLTDGGLSAIVQDTTPQLGGDLDTNGNDIQFDDTKGIRDDSDNELLTFGKTASAVNQMKLSNAATGSDPTFEATGDDTNVGVHIKTKGTGDFKAGNFVFDGDQSVGAGQDDYVLTYDHSAGKIGLEAAAGGGGATVLVGSSTANGASSVSFTGLTSTYAYYILEFSNVVPSADDAFLILRTSTNGGSSYDSGASDYTWVGHRMIGTGSDAIHNDNAASRICLTPDTATLGLGTASNEKGSGTVTIHNPSASEYCKVLFSTTYHNSASASYTTFYGGGSRLAAADVDAVQVRMSSGNISGEFRIYGVTNA